jgi:hypothetical protein
MEVGLIIQGNPLWDFLESASCSCVLHTSHGFVLCRAAGDFAQLRRVRTAYRRRLLLEKEE